MNLEHLIGQMTSASDTGRSVDAIFWGLVAISGFMVLLLATLVVGFCVRYRRGAKADRSASSFPSTRIEIAWTVAPLLIFLGLFYWAGAVYFQMSRPPLDAMEIHVVAKQWMWKIQQPSGQREINELHLPAGRAVSLIMISQDVIHSFFVPAFRSKQDVLPGRYTRIWFTPVKTGTYHLFCAEYCGTDHSAMVGVVHVMEPAEYTRWMAAGETPESMVAAGRRLFFSRGCSGCHATGSQIPSPLLDNIYGKAVGLADGTTVIADETYLRDSILLPNKQVVGGYEPVMPTFQGQLDEEEVFQIVAYLKSLKNHPLP
jgi:cytochrome c oxidase subunit 2